MSENHSLEQLESFASHAVDNEIEILKSHECGCFFCRSVFDARKVQDWVSDERGTSAVCPNCGMDAVLGDEAVPELTKPLLKEMNLTFYGDNYMKEHPEALIVYCQRYIDGKITHKEHSELLFIKYLTYLAMQGNPKAALTLGTLYDVGTEFTARDWHMALACYENPSLSSDSNALIAIGRIELNDINDDSSPWRAYENFSKAAALGSLTGVFELAHCYLDGVFVERNPRFAMSLLEETYDDVYSRFITDRKNYCDFIDYSYHLGLCYQRGTGTKKDHWEALRFFLLARYGIEVQKELDQAYNKRLWSDIQKRIEKLAEEFHYVEADPVYDQDTFYDTFSHTNETMIPKCLTPVNYDEASGVLEFDVNYVLPPLIVDIANLFCGLASGTIRWKFTDVAYFKATSEKIFEEVTSPDNESWTFEHHDMMTGKSEAIAELRFYSDPNALKSLTEKRNGRKGQEDGGDDGAE